MAHIKCIGYMGGLALVVSILLAGCGRQQDYGIVEMSGADAAYNISRSWIYFGSYADQEGIVSLPAGTGDLLYAINEEFDQSAFIFFDKDTGNKPALSFDTLFPAAVFVNGVIHSLNLTLDSIPPEVPQANGEYNLATLKTLYLNLPLSRQIREWLDSTFEYIRPLNLVLEGEDRNEEVRGLLERFRPRSVYMPQLVMPDYITDWSRGLENTTMLVISREVLRDADPVTDLASLASLIIIDDGDELSVPPDLSGLRNLRNLTMIDFMHIDISWFSSHVKLENLFLVNTDSISSKNELARLGRLKALGLTFSDWDEELPVLGGLQWMAMPRNISQDRFADWCGQNQGIRVLEIIGTITINGLEPLENLPELSVLMVDVPLAPVDPLKKLTRLELLVIGQDIYDDPGVGIDQLKDSLPATRIVPGGGFCLGSGWILLILPVILVLLLTDIRRKRYIREPYSRMNRP